MSDYRTYTPYGQRWDDLPTWFAEENLPLDQQSWFRSLPAETQAIVAAATTVPSVTDNRYTIHHQGDMTIVFSLVIPFRGTVCRWLHAGACACCGEKFAQTMEKDLDRRWENPAEMPRELTICTPCHAQKVARRSRVTSKRYRDEHRTEQPLKVCKQCGATFRPKRSTARFCSDLCRIHRHRGVHHF